MLPPPKPAQAPTAKTSKIDEYSLQGFKLFRLLEDLFSGLREESPNTNRKLHYDQYAALLLFSWFNPAIDSLRGISAVSGFERVRQKLKVERASLGSLSAAQSAFDPELLAELIPPLVARLGKASSDKRLSELEKVLTAVDGTLLRTLSRVAWALWTDDSHRAAKAHVQFELLKGAPSRATVTAGNESEIDQLRGTLEAGRLYVLDRGYASWKLLSEIIEEQSSFVCRVGDRTVYKLIEEKELTDADRDARVISDKVVWIGERKKRNPLSKAPLRLVEIHKVDAPSKRRRAERKKQEEPTPTTVLVATDNLELPAELIAQIYAMRWKIEIFFRWLKCILGCRRLMAESRAGVAIQLYTALIACLLISLWTGKKPTKRAFEAICLHLQGWVSLDELISTIGRLKPHPT